MHVYLFNYAKSDLPKCITLLGLWNNPHDHIIYIFSCDGICLHGANIRLNEHEIAMFPSLSVGIMSHFAY
jgi:hypothetical protein